MSKAFSKFGATTEQTMRHLCRFSMGPVNSITICFLTSAVMSRNPLAAISLLDKVFFEASRLAIAEGKWMSMSVYDLCLLLCSLAYAGLFPLVSGCDSAGKEREQRYNNHLPYCTSWVWTGCVGPGVLGISVTLNRTNKWDSDSLPVQTEQTKHFGYVLSHCVLYLQINTFDYRCYTLW